MLRVPKKNKGKFVCSSCLECGAPFPTGFTMYLKVTIDKNYPISRRTLPCCQQRCQQQTTLSNLEGQQGFLVRFRVPLQSEWSLPCDRGNGYASSCENNNNCSILDPIPLVATVSAVLDASLYILAIARDTKHTTHLSSLDDSGSNKVSGRKILQNPRRKGEEQGAALRVRTTSCIRPPSETNSCSMYRVAQQ